MENFESIFHTYFKPLVLFAQRITRDEMEGQDIVIDIFIKIHDKGLPVTKGFLYISVMNKCRDFIRKNKSRKDFPIPDSEMVTFQKELDDISLLEEIWREIERLPKSQKEVMVLKFVGGLTNAEIAKLKKTGESAVRFNCFRAYIALRKRISFG